MELVASSIGVAASSSGGVVPMAVMARLSVVCSAWTFMIRYLCSGVKWFNRSREWTCEAGLSVPRPRHWIVQVHTTTNAVAGHFATLLRILIFLGCIKPAPASPGSRPVMKCVARFQATRVLCENVGGRLMELSWPKNTNARQQTNSGVSGRNVEYRQRQHQCLADEVAVRRWPRSDLLLQRGRRDPARGKAERRHVWLRTR